VGLCVVPLVFVSAAQVRGADAAPVALAKASPPVELAGLRTEKSRTLQNSDGSFTDEVYTEPVNYKDHSGAWQPIDSRLVSSNAPGFAYENAANAFAVRFARAASGVFSEFESRGGRVSLSLLGVDQGVATAASAVTADAKGEVVYPDVEAGANLAYRLTAVGVKESIVLKDASAPSSYSFLLHPASGQKLTPKHEADGSWAFTAADGSVAFRLAAPVVLESSGSVVPKQCSSAAGSAPPVCHGGPSGAPPGPPNWAAGISADDGSSAVVTVPSQGALDVVDVGGDFKVTVSVDSGWLSSSKRVFPVVLDPTVVLSGSLDTDGTFTMDCATCTPDVTSDHVKVGFDGTHTYQAASKFDLSSVPGGSKIVSATLNATFDHCFPADGYPDPNVGCSWVWPWQSMTLDAHRISSNWSATTQSQNFATDSAVVASQGFQLGYPGVGIGPGTWLQWDVTSLAQQWSSGIQPNYGIALNNSQTACGSFSSSPCGVTIEDSRNASTTYRPHLDITYRPTLGAQSQYPMWSNGPLAVNEATGNLVLSAPSPSFPTAVGALTLPITYNSLYTATPGPFGAGWTAGPTSWLIDHASLGDSASVEQFFGDGSTVVFTRAGSSNVYQAQDGSNSLLMKNTTSPVTFTLVGGDGSVSTYGAPDGTTGYAQLTDVETLAASSGTSSISYGFTSGRLSSITAKDGSTTIATLRLDWAGPTCSGALVCVSGPDGQQWKYIGAGSGGTSGSLQTIFDGQRNILRVSYDSSGRPQTIQNANDLNPPSGYNATHNLTISYDGAGKVASVANGPISGQTPATSTWSFGYHPDTSGTTKADPTIAAHGSVTAGTQRAAAGYTIVTPPCEQAAGTCAGHSGTAQVKVYYDTLAQTMERVELPGSDGVVRHTQMQYSDSGQLLWTEDEDGNPTDYSYDAVDNTLSSVTSPDPDGSGPATRPVTSYNYEETAYGSVSGSTYTAGTALQGVQANYYTTPNFVDTSGGTPVGRPTKAETAVQSGSFSFAWGAVGPPALFSSGTNSNYSVRFVGDLSIPAGSSPTMEFQTVAEGGTQLTVDNLSLIDNLTGSGQSTQPSTGAVVLPAGKHRLVLNYVENAASPTSNLSLQYRCDSSCGTLPTSFTDIPASVLTPAWGNRTSVVSASGRVAFSHYAKPETGNPDYSLAYAPVNGTNAALITSYGYDSLGRLTGKVMPNGNTGATLTAGTLSGAGTPSTSNWGTVYAFYADTATATTPAPVDSSCPASAANVPQLGLLNAVTQHGLRSVTTIYDAAGRPVSTSKAAGTTIACYDPEGRLVCKQSPRRQPAHALHLRPKRQPAHRDARRIRR
jgi:YD repeat-containing protein